MWVENSLLDDMVTVVITCSTGLTDVAHAFADMPIGNINLHSTRHLLLLVHKQLSWRMIAHSRSAEWGHILAVVCHGLIMCRQLCYNTSQWSTLCTGRQRIVVSQQHHTLHYSTTIAPYVLGTCRLDADGRRRAQVAPIEHAAYGVRVHVGTVAAHGRHT